MQTADKCAMPDMVQGVGAAFSKAQVATSSLCTFSAPTHRRPKGTPGLAGARTFGVPRSGGLRGVSEANFNN